MTFTCSKVRTGDISVQLPVQTGAADDVRSDIMEANDLVSYPEIAADYDLGNSNYRKAVRTTTSIKRDGVISRTTFAVDGVTPVFVSTFKNGIKTTEIDFKADGITPDTFMDFRPDGTVSSLTDFSNKGTALSTTHFAADGFSPKSIVYYAADGQTPAQIATFDEEGSANYASFVSER